MHNDLAWSVLIVRLPAIFLSTDQNTVESHFLELSSDQKKKDRDSEDRDSEDRDSEDRDSEDRDSEDQDSEVRDREKDFA